MMRTVSLSADWDDDWRFEARGQYAGGADRRGIFAMRHPWEASREGDYAQVSRRVTIPADWQGPRVLSFMAADSHHGRDYIYDEWRDETDVDIFAGHRFCQALVDGEVAWELDVAETDAPVDHQCSLIAHTLKPIGLFWGPGARRYPGAQAPTGDGDPPPFFDVYRCVDLSGRVKPGDSFLLTLRVCDRVGSETVLPGDVHGFGSEDPADNRGRFQMTAWWADVCLVDEETVPARVVADRVALAPVHDDTPGPAAGGGVELTIVRGEALPPVPYPLWGGVPFPPGALADPDRVSLAAADGAAIPVQSRARSRWAADGSVQWLDLTCVVPPGVRGVLLRYGTGAAPAPIASPVAVTRDGDRVSIGTGELSLELREGSAALLESFQAAGGPAWGPVTGVLDEQMVGYTHAHRTVVERVEVEEAGPVRAAVALHGRLDDGQGHRFGRFTARVWVWAGCPLFSFTFRVFQDSDHPVAIVHQLLLEVGQPALEGLHGAFTSAWRGPLQPGRLEELELRQEQAHAYAVTGRATLESGEHAPGWVGAQGALAGGAGAGLGCGVRWFWQQCPKTLTLTPDRLIVGLFGRRRHREWLLDAGTTSFMTRGEAKRHSLWFMPYAGERSPELLQQVQAAWDARPHLLNREWVAASGAVGNLAPLDGARRPELAEWLRRLREHEMGEPLYGIRDWLETRWCQNYRGRAANALLLHFAGAGEHWQDYFEQVMHHNLDVDTIHWEPEHPDWVGALRSWSPFHTMDGPAFHVGSNCQDQFLHCFFTGEPDSWDEAQRAARYIARQHGNQDRSARYEGWPLAQMAIAYAWTGEADFQQSAEAFLDYAARYTHPRRGAYDEVHGSFSHRGIVPFMTGYLGYGLIRYHQATGDARAARLLVALAEASVIEASDGQGGYPYSPNPKLAAPNGAPPSVNIGGMLAYAYRLTGDPWFARQAHLTCRRLIDDAGEQMSFVSLDMCQNLGELLSGLDLARRRGDLGAEK